MSRRARLALTAPVSRMSSDAFRSALAGGDVACLLVRNEGIPTPEYLSACVELMAVAQESDTAIVVSEDTQVFGRSEADGIFIESGIDELREMVARFSPHKIVGCGGISGRHHALEVGECKPDFVFFGKPGMDVRAEPHAKNLSLASWWAELVEIPCIVQAGNSLQSIVDCARTGAEFIAVETAVLDYQDGVEAAVRKANQLLDEHAPEFSEE